MRSCFSNDDSAIDRIKFQVKIWSASWWQSVEIKHPDENISEELSFKGNIVLIIKIVSIGLEYNSVLSRGLDIGDIHGDKRQLKKIDLIKWIDDHLELEIRRVDNFSSDIELYFWEIGRHDSVEHSRKIYCDLVLG